MSLLTISKQQLRSRISQREVRVQDAVPVPFLRSSGSGKVCLICTSNKSSYCCPRCYIPYCSAVCYAKHDVDCTEGFNRQQVKQVLDLEAVYGRDPSASPTTSTAEETSFQTYSKAWENSQYEPQFNSVDDEDIDEQDNAEDQAQTEESEVHEPFEGTTASADITVDALKHIPPHLVSRCVQLWVPWWHQDINNVSIALSSSSSTSSSPQIHNEEQMPSTISNQHIRQLISAAINRIQRTAPRLNSLINTDKISKDLLGYQIVGMLLGYVVTLRSLNGEWYVFDPQQDAPSPLIPPPHVPPLTSLDNTIHSYCVHASPTTHPQ